MSVVCRTCSRVNPAEARYCYHDGAALGAAGQQGAPVAAGSRPFPSPFVFPSGRACRNFDELVLACETDWAGAQELLRQGYLESFLGALGRADLALAARQCAREPDADRSLDQFLNKLPTGRREPPRLFAQPLVVNLGQLPRQCDHRFLLHLENQGMGLLCGSVACEQTSWLVLGDAPGAPRKVFQCRHDLSIPVQVLGKRLRAGSRPLEGRLVIESNGGSAVVSVRCEVPVQPYPDGVLAGACTPRQVAEKARAYPREAAVLFEKGAVAAWYEANGWTYPVQGPASSGVAAVQQFFEALGLVMPPRVRVRESSIQLQGAPGEALESVLHVETHESRHVFAHAVSTAPWLRPGRPVLNGRIARIPLCVPAVPALPGERLTSEVHVTANGNQRFAVAVALTVSTQPRATPAQVPVAVLADEVAEVIRSDDRVPEAAQVEVADEAPAGRRRGRFGRHLLPLGVLLLGLFGVVLHDLLLPPETGPGGEDPGPALVDPDPYIALRFHDRPDDGGEFGLEEPTMSFGLVMRRERDPQNPGHFKKLMYDEMGRSNNTCLRIDGREALFGHGPGRWVEMKGALEQGKVPWRREGLRSSWLLERFGLLVTQTAEVVPGEQSACLDTCQVRYTLENRDSLPHRVGIRFLLDTFIGANDGVPFTVPGAADLCATRQRFDRPEEVPDYIQALENSDLLHPGTVAHVQFRLGKDLEAPSRVLLGGYPDAPLRQLGYAEARAWFTHWDVPWVSMRELYERADEIPKRRRNQIFVPDSAVTLYWDEKPLDPGARREVGFTYGLGRVASRESEGKLLLAVGGRTVRGGEFTLTALVRDPAAGERLTLTLPQGFALVGGSLEQDVPPVAAGAARPISPVTWRLRAGNVGRYQLLVRSRGGVTQKQDVRIRKPPAPGVLD